MPSSLVVPVALVDKILPHPNADKLEIAHVLGWQVVVRKGEFSEGQRVVYFPPDTVLPQELSDRLGVTQYLSKGRIRCAKLRGEPSFGLAIPVADPAWELGWNAAEWYGATKYEPPVRPNAGDVETPDPLFVEYTNIENMRNFPDIVTPGETVVVTEKIHGTSCRVGVIQGALMAGSHRQRRKEPEDKAYGRNTYWSPLEIEGVRDLMNEFSGVNRQVILFGEVYGAGIQSFTYGLKNATGFRAFDLMFDGKYAGAEEFAKLMDEYDIPRVPVLYQGPFDIEKIRELSGGETTLAEGANIREGVVVRPLIERTDPKVGRVCLKYLSDQYLFAEKSDYTEQ